MLNIAVMTTNTHLAVVTRGSQTNILRVKVPSQSAWRAFVAMEGMLLFRLILSDDKHCPLVVLWLAGDQSTNNMESHRGPDQPLTVYIVCDTE